MKVHKAALITIGVTAFAGAALAAICCLYGKKRGGSEGAPSAARVQQAGKAFPQSDYQTPRNRAARVQSAAGQSVRPYARLASSATNYTGCVSALRGLPAALTPAQFETLRDAIAVPFSPGMSCTPLEFNGLRNAAAEFLLQQPDFPPDLLLDFAGMHDDPAQDPVWRDYCLQMLVTGWQNLEGRGGMEADEARGLAVKKLLAATGSRSHTWPGTALLGLRLVSESDSAAFPSETLDRMILDVAADRSASEAARVTALRLAGERRLAEARGVAEELARSPAATPMLRVCAVATLGDLDDHMSRAQKR